MGQGLFHSALNLSCCLGIQNRRMVRALGVAPKGIRLDVLKLKKVGLQLEGNTEFFTAQFNPLFNNHRFRCV